MTTYRRGCRSTKTYIETQAISGLPLDLTDIARISRDRRVITLRHVWADDIDARVWGAIREAVWSRAQEIADQERHDVMIASADGYTMASIETEGL